MFKVVKSVFISRIFPVICTRDHPPLQRF